MENGGEITINESDAVTLTVEFSEPVEMDTDLKVNLTRNGRYPEFQGFPDGAGVGTFTVPRGLPNTTWCYSPSTTR